MSLGSIDWPSPARSGLHIPRLREINVDVPLLVTILLVAAIGFVVLYSATGGNDALIVRQGVRFAIGLGAFFVLAQVPPQHLRIWTPRVFFVVLAMLATTLVTGAIYQGAQRWLNIGLLSFQPSEIMKLAVPMMVAWYMHDRPLPPRTGHLLVLMAVVLVPAVLVYLQPDLGTSILVAAAGFLAVLLAGLRLRTVFAFGGLGIGAAAAIWPYLHDYQKNRVLCLLRPESDPLGACYNGIQSKIAIGSGGLFGKGWFEGTQAQLEFLPERSTDFIFAVMAEEFGFLGVTALLVLYLVLIGRGLYIATQAQDTFTRLLAGSLSLTFFLYVFINAGMVTGLLPVVGVPLPLVSAGGTSMVTLLAGFGMLAAIGGHRKLLAP